MKKYFLLGLLSLATYISVLGQLVGDYRSASSGNWDVASTWETYNGTAWVTAASTPDFNSGAINVLAGHTVNIVTNVIIDETSVDIGGAVVVAVVGVLEINDSGAANDLIVSGSMNVDGILRKNQGVTISSTMATLSINFGGVYEHNNTVSIGNIPIATWQVGSTCRIVGYTNVAGGVFPVNNFGQDFYNFDWSCAGQTSNINLVGLLTTVNGDFSANSTGSASLRLWGNTNSSTLNVGGSFGVANATVYTNYGIATPTLNLAGNFYLFSGTFGSFGTGSTTINFMGYSQIDIDNAFVTQTGNLHYVGIGIMDFVNPLSEITSDSVNSSFTLTPNGAMYITHAGGIAATGSNTGCIQLTTRTYDSDGTYIYIAGTPQVTGTGLPTIITGNLQIQNGTPLASGGVILTQATMLTGLGSEMDFFQGKLITTPSTMLTLDVDCYMTYNILIAFVEGPMQWNTNASIEYYFPLGEIDRYMPMSMFPQNNSLENYICTAHYSPANNNNALSPTICSISNVEYWDITGTSPAEIKLYWDAMSGINETALQQCNTLVVAHYDGNTNVWESKGNSATDFTNDFVISGTYSGNFITEAHTFGQACGLSTMASTVSPTCGLSNGAIDVMVMNGSGSYNYSWNDGILTEDRNNISAGTYILYVEEASGGCTDTFSISLTNTAGVQASATVINNVSCTGNDGSASITASGGSGTYLYSWTPTYYNTSAVSTLSNGNYTVYVKDAADSTCIDTVGLFIGGYIASGIAVNDTFSVCTVGGTTILPVLLNDIGGLNGFSLLALTSPPANTGTLANNGNGTFSFTLAAGFSGTTSFDYEIADTAGCTSNASVFITASPLPQPSISANGTTTFCQGGNVILTSSSATGNLWSTGDTTQSITVSTSGSFSVTVTIGNCSATSPATVVTVSALPPIPIINANGPTTFCQGNNVTLTSSSTTGNVWSTTAVSQSIVVNTVGTYTVTVTNAAGCSATSAPTAVIVNTLPSIPTISLNGNNIFCQGGSVNLISSYTTGNTWSNGDTSNNITVTTSGTYSVTYTNANGCSATSAPVTITVNPNPPVPVISTSGATTFCQGGNVVLSSNYSIGNVWSTSDITQNITVNGSGTYTVMVTDANGCSATSLPTTVTVNPIPPVPSITINGDTALCQGESVILNSSATSNNVWSSGQTTQAITVSAAGIYSVTVSQNGCSATSNPVNIVVNPLPTAPIITVNGSQPICAGASINISSNVSTGNLWSTGQTSQSITVTAGTYSLTYTDANGCSAASAPITITALAPLTVVANVLSNSDCGAPIGSAIAFASGGSGNFIYSWNSNPPQIAQTALGLTGGTFTVTASDASNGNCTAMTSVIISGGNAPVVSLNLSGNLTACENKPILAQASGAAAYIWLHNGITVGIGAVYTMSVAGTYQVIGFSNSAATGCSDTSEIITLSILPTPKASVFAIGPLEVCPETEVILRAESGTDASYLWLLNGQPTTYTNDTISVSSTGYYSVIANNLCGKDTSAAVYVNIHLRPIADFEYEPTPAQVGEAVQFTDKSVSAALWNWAFGDSKGTSILQNPIYTYNAAGNYTVTMYINDNLGCKDTMSHVIEVVEPGTNTIGFIPNVFSPNGDGEFDEWEIKYGQVNLIALNVYDRWGAKVFETTDASKLWNGKKKGQECAAGVYYYIIQATNQQGTNLVQKGTITLIR